MITEMHVDDFESDDFALTTLLQKIQNGEEVAAEEFHNFIKKGKELIAILQKTCSSFLLVHR